MKISHIEHIGIAVESIEAVLPYFENVLGLKCYNIEVVEDQKVKTAFLKCGEVKLELLEPTSPESTIAKYIEKKGQGMHHMAFCIEDGVANALAEAEAAGIRLIDKAPRKGAENLNIAFLHPKRPCLRTIRRGIPGSCREYLWRKELQLLPPFLPQRQIR